MSEEGRRFGGRYLITRRIASGGMAEVYMATDELLGRTVALKLLHPEYARDGAFIERFRREARAAASLSDPRIVSIFDWGSDEGTYYIVMEYVEGRSLKEMITSQGPFTPQRAVEIAADVCSALQAAHKRGIVHRDIKPANIIVTPGGETKVMDFGIARAPQESGETVTQTGTVMGTANYISPEQALAMPVDARSDVYSTGVVLYEMLTRDVPFKADTAVAIAYKHVKEDPVPPSQLNADVSPDLDAVVLKAMAKNPENRYQSAEELRQDLERLLRGQPTEATPLLPDRTTVLRSGGETIALAAADVVTQRRPAPPPPKAGRGAVIALVILLCIGLLAAAVAFAFGLVGETQEAVEIPNVVNLDLAEATRLLQSRGLGIEPAGAVPSDLDPGVIVRQDPAEGLKRERGSSVRVFTSAGPDVVEVPDLRGKTADEARRILAQAGLSLGSVAREFNNDVEADRITRQLPAASDEIEPGRAVDVWVSAGQETVRLVDVTRISEEQARQALIGLGLNPVRQTTCNADEREGYVLAQQPGPGNVPKGSDVTITVNVTAQVPQVQDQTEEEAVSALQGRGFEVEIVEEAGGLLPSGRRGRVTDQQPQGGTVACPGDTVRITIQQ